MRAASLLFVALAGSVAAALPAHAQDNCTGFVGCVENNVLWSHEEEAFNAVSLDAGWVPAGAPIQLRIGLFVGAGTQIEMESNVVHRWQPAIEGFASGISQGGRLEINYGIELVVQLRFDVTIAGIRYTWTGDIPVPSIPGDLRAAAVAMLDPFALPPSARPIVVQDTTDDVSVLRYDTLGGFISVPGVSGGITLNVQAALEAAYQTDRIIFEGKAPILTELGSVLLPARSIDGYGSELISQVHPEGTLVHRGTIYVRPSLYLDFVGTRRDYPLVEIPIELVDDTRNVIFPTEEIEVPLPDLVMDASVPDGDASMAPVVMDIQW